LLLWQCSWVISFFFAISYNVSNMRREEGDASILEVADAFDREVAELSQSETFMAFLVERSKEPGAISLDDIDRKLAQEE